MNKQERERLLALISHSDRLPPSEITWVITTLIRIEEKPGGPYRLFADTRKNGDFNDAIVSFIAKLQNTANTPPPTINISDEIKQQRDSRYQYAEKIIATLSPSLEQRALTALRRIRKSDQYGEISLLSTYFSRCLEKQPTATAIEALDHANILVWVSYTLLDAVIDGDGKSSPLDSLAAVATLREAQELYRTASAWDIAQPLLAEVDDAMAEEFNRNHTKNTYSKRQLFDRMGSKSIAHIAGPLYLAKTYSSDIAPVAEEALRLYCQSRQLLDDIHDINEDRENGHHTYATYQSANNATPEQQLKTIVNLLATTQRIAQKSSALLTNISIENSAIPTFTTVTSGRIETIARQGVQSIEATSKEIKQFLSNL